VNTQPFTASSAPAATAWGGVPVKPLPRLLATLLCEDAAASVGLNDGRVSLTRVFFDLYAAKFPAGFDRLVVVNWWSGGEGMYHVGVRLTAPDGAELSRGETQLTAAPEPPQTAGEGRPATFAQVMYFPRLALPAPGKYAVEMALDGVPVSVVALHVITPTEKKAEGKENADGQK